MTRTWEDRGWPYTPALALALGPFLVFVARIVFGAPCQWQEVRAWGVAVAVGAIVAHAYLVLIITLSGVWAVVQGREWCVHAAKLSAVQLSVGSYLTFHSFHPSVGLTSLAGGVVVVMALIVRWSCTLYRQRVTG